MVDKEEIKDKEVLTKENTDSTSTQKSMEVVTTPSLIIKLN